MHGANVEVAPQIGTWDKPVSSARGGGSRVLFSGMRSLHLPCFALGVALSARATTWTVGPGQPYTLPSQVSELVDDGDTVNIEAGVYPSDVARWQANDLVLRGVGGLAHLESNGLAWGGKAIWVIQGDRTTVEWIEFSECAVPDQNGAGIRQEGLGLTVRHCHFHDNENGILAGELHPCTIRIEHSEFARNGFGDGYSHNLYIGQVDSLIFRFNYSHHAHVGHELKSRAWVNLIEYNRIGNELDGDASREIDLPNGGQAYIIGNVLQQGINGANSNMVGFGMEGLSNPAPQELYAVNNTLVNEKTNGTFFQVGTGDVFFKAYSNVLAGGGNFLDQWPGNIDTLANLRNTLIAWFQFAAPQAYDFHIDVSSPAHNAGFPGGLAGSGYPLVAWYEYVHPTDGILRCQHALLDAGAFETCTTGVDREDDDAATLYPVPATDRLTVRLSREVTILGIEIFDQGGRRIQRFPDRLMGQLSVDVSDLGPGLFVVRILTSSGALVRTFEKL